MSSKQGRGGGRSRNTYTFDIKPFLGDEYQVPSHEFVPQMSNESFPPLPKLPVPLKRDPTCIYGAKIRQHFIDVCRRNYYVGCSTKSGFDKFRSRNKAIDPGRFILQKFQPKIKALMRGARLHPDGKLMGKKDKEAPIEAMATEKTAQAATITTENEDENLEGDENNPLEDNNPGDKNSDEEENRSSAEEEVEDEEEAEQITDYISSYFDNGEDYGEEEDDKYEDGLAW